MMYITKNTIASFSDSDHNDNDDSDNDYDNDYDESMNEDFDGMHLLHNVHMQCCLCIHWTQHACFHLHQLYIIIM